MQSHSINKHRIQDNKMSTSLKCFNYSIINAHTSEQIKELNLSFRFVTNCSIEHQSSTRSRIFHTRTNNMLMGRSKGAVRNQL